MNLETGVLQVHIEDIIPNRFQPRLSFDEQGLKELSDSIREHGIIQPLVLRKLGDKYEIIAGERRYKAAQIAGLTTVPAVIANIDDNKSAEVALVENVQRRDLTAIEEARSYKNLLDKGYLTQEQLAKRMGLSQPSIANKLRLLNLDEEVQQALLEEKISERHARSLLTLTDKNAQKEWLHRIINERLTVRQLDTELKRLKNANSNVMIGDEEEGTGEIPVVSGYPSLEDIKANAMDIGMANRKPMPTAEPEVLETLEEPVSSMPSNNMFAPATNIPPSNIASAGVDNSFVEPMNDFGNPTGNKFLSPMNNFEEPINNSFAEPMNNNRPEPMNDFMTQNNNIQINNFDNDMFIEPMNNNPIPQNNFNDFGMNNNAMFQDLSSNNVPNNPFDNFKDDTAGNNMFNEFNSVPNNNMNEPVFNNPIEQPAPQIDTFTNVPLNTSFDTNPNNKFFTPVSDQSSGFDSLEIKQKEFDPMEKIDDMIPGNQVQTSNGGIELIDAIQEIRTCIEGLGEKGCYINVEEIDFENNYQITIQIEK